MFVFVVAFRNFWKEIVWLIVDRVFSVTNEQSRMPSKTDVLVLIFETDSTIIILSMNTAHATRIIRVDIVE